MGSKISLDALTALETIERMGSFAAAAAQLRRVPSALTYTMGRLEDDLGVRLFDRSGRRASLTPAGRELLEEGRTLLALADQIERRVQQVARGWEVELRIALDLTLDASALLPLVAEFDGEKSGTRVRLSYEVLAGTWDALQSGRADLVIGANGEPVSQAGLSLRRVNPLPFVFAVAPAHPLASMREPLAPAEIQRYRAVAVADTARNQPARSTGLLLGQESLTVPDFAAKVAAQRAGLGVGYLPAPIARAEHEAGRLVIKQVAEPKLESFQYMAWKTASKGKALAWFLGRLDTGACTALVRTSVAG